MAAFDTHRTSVGSHGLFGHISATITATVSAVASWNDARATRKALSALTDRELDDIGLCRGDIDAVIENKRVF